MFEEMRLAATLQAVRRGPGALPAREVLWMATRGGARALGLEDQIGSIEPGKRADLVLLDAPNYLHLVYHFGVNLVTRTMRGGEWVVVGIFDYGRTAGNCALYADGATMLSAFGRNAYNEADVMLESAGAFSTLAGALEADPSLRLKAWREEELVASFTQQLIGMLKFVSYFVGTIIAVAATIGAANSLYAIVDGRRRELATLRALGFNASPIVASILSESILLAMPGALLGTLIAWVGFDGLVARGPLGSTFPLVVTPQLALLGVGWALGISAIGGLLPAVKAARASVTTGLRAT